MCYYVVNHDNKTITKCETKDQAQSLCILGLSKSRSLCVFYYNEVDFKNLYIDKSEFEELAIY